MGGAKKVSLICQLGPGGDGGTADGHAEFQPPKELSSMEKHMHGAYLVSFDVTYIYRAYGSLLIIFYSILLTSKSRSHLRER